MHARQLRPEGAYTCCKGVATVVDRGDVDLDTVCGVCAPAHVGAREVRGGTAGKVLPRLVKSIEFM